MNQKCNHIRLYKYYHILFYNGNHRGGLMFKIDNELNGANVARTIRFTEKLFDILNTYAAQNNVSFNSLVLQCCKYAMDNSDNSAVNLPE